MKKMTFLALTMIFALLSSALQAQTDVTAQYLTNADFETAPIAFLGPGNAVNPDAASLRLSASGLGSLVYVPPGWTAECGTPGATGNNLQYTRAATGVFGVDYTTVPDPLNGVEFPSSGGRVGAFLAMSGGYATTSRLVQNVTLPAGSYTLQYDVYDQNPGSTRTFTNRFGFVPNSGTAVYDNVTFFTASAWETRSVSFTLDALTVGKISIGITGNSGNSGANAHLAVDNIKLLYNGDITSTVPPLKAELTSLRDSVDRPASYNLTAVNTLLATAPTEANALQLIADLNAAIATLKGVIAQNMDATLASLTVNDAAISGFAPATLSYSYLVTGAGVPVVAAAVASTYASVSITQASAVPGVAKVTVTAGNGKQQVYTINFGQPMALPVSGSYYKIKSFATDSTYIGGKGTGSNSVLHEIAATNTDYHLFLLTGDNTNGFTFKQVVSGNYITHNNGFTGSYAAETGTNRQLFNFDNLVSPDYLVIKKKQDNGTFSNGLGFDSGVANSQLFTDKGTDKGNQWVFEQVIIVTLMKVALENAITTAKNTLTTTVEGNAVGQYPSKTELQAAVATAEGVLSSATTQPQIDDAVTVLNAAVAAYQATKVFIISSGNVYRIRNYTTTNTYIGGTGTGADAVIHVSATTNPDYQLFYVSGNNTAGWSFLQVASGLYMTHNNSWTGSYVARTGTNRQLFNLDDTNSNYVLIKKKTDAGTFTDGIGYNSATSGSILYFDKGSSSGNRWVFEKVDNPPLVTISLEQDIASAQTLYNKAVEGAEPGQYTGSKAALQTAIASAQTALDAAKAEPPTVTQPDVENAITALQTAVQTFESSQIIVNFSPDPTAFYRIYTADQTRWPNQYLYSTGTAAEANQRHAVLTNDTDSTYLYQFVQENGNWMIRPAAEKDKAAADQLYIYERGSGGSGMAALTKKAHDNTSRFVVAWSKRENGVDYFTFRSERGYWLLFGANSNDLKSTNEFGVDPSGNVSSIGSFQFAIIQAHPRVKLEQLIKQANYALSSATVGTAMTNHPQAAVDRLTTAVALATVLYNNSDATNEELTEATAALQPVYDWFISQEICFSTQYVGQPLWVVHSSGNLLSKVRYSNYAVINELDKPNALQTFEFEAVPGMVDVVALKASDGKYLSYNSWNTPWIDSINANVHMKMSVTSDGYLSLKMVGNNLLGTDVSTDSATVYANKSGSNILYKWQVQTPGSVIKIKLRATIVQSDTLLNHISVGAANFQFPAADYNAFVAVLNASKTLWADNNATQEQVDAQVEVLQAALETFYSKQNLPVFTPETSARYLVTNRSYSGYLTDNGLRAVVESNVPLDGWEILKLTDSTYVFKNGDLVLAQSLNMVTYAPGTADQVWKLHYDGAKAYEVYTPAETDYHFAFIGGTNAIQFTSSGQVQLVAGHSHSSQAQWFKMVKIGAPITTTLSTLIASVQSVLSSATVGTAYGNYPQAAKDSLTTALTHAESALENAATMTQAQINAAVTDLQNALTWFNNQKIVWRPAAGMAYFIGNRENANYFSIDTLNVGVAKGYKLDSIPFVNQLWFFVPVENKAGFYHIVNGKNSVGNSGGTSIFVEEYDPATAKQIEVKYQATAAGIDYFVLTTTNTYPNIHIDSNGNISSDRFTYENYQLKLVEAGALRTEVFHAIQLRDSASVGNGIGQYTQASYDTFVGVINTSIEIATDGNSANDEAQLQLLQEAENTFRTSQNGYGLNLSALLAAVEIANDLLETTTVVGSSPGQCPQTAVDALVAAIKQAQDATGGITQVIVDQKVTALNQAIANFKTALKASTGLTNLLTDCLTDHSKAVEGTSAGQYAAGSKAIFKAAIDVAQAAFDKEPVRQADLIAAYDVLNDARDKFTLARVSDLDTRDLEELIVAVEAFLAGKPAGEYAGLRAKLAKAQAVLANPETQDQIDAMLEELYEALEGSGIEQLFAAGVKVFAADGALHISGLTAPAQVGIFNMLGQQILSEKVTGSDFVQPLKKGLYIVTVNSIHLKVLVK